MSVLRFIFDTTKPYKLFLVGIFSVVCIISLDNNVKPYLIKLLIDTAAGSSTYNIWTLIFIYAGFQILIISAWTFSDWLNANFVPSYRIYLATILTNRLNHYSYSFFQNNLSGNLMAKIGDSFSLIPTIIITMNYQFFQFGLTAFITIFLLAKLQIFFAVGLVIWIIFFSFITYLGLKKVMPLTKEYAESRSKLWGHLSDYLTNILNVKLFTNFVLEKKKFQYIGADFRKKAKNQGYLLMNFYALQGITLTIYTISFLLWLIYLQTHNRISPGDFSLVFMLNFKISDSMFELSNQLRDFIVNWGTVEQALTILNSTPLEVVDKINAEKSTITKGEIIFDQVKFHYNGAEPLFQNKSILIEAGQKIGLVGYSGSGKTTFVNLILRLYDVNDGRILIDGQDIRDMTQASLHSSIGLIPQDPSLFHRSIMENIHYGRIEASNDEVIQAAKRAHAHDFIMKLPLKYNSMVGERGVKLSGGQRQRIAIARCLLKNAPILILDEATSQLDSITENIIQESIWDLMHGKTAIVIAHRLSTLLHMNRIIVFDQGKIVGDGAHQDLLNNSEMYKSLWDNQVGGFLPRT